MARESIITRLCIRAHIYIYIHIHMQYICDIQLFPPRSTYILRQYYIYVYLIDALKGLAGSTTTTFEKTKTFFIFSRVGATMRSAESDLDCVYALQRSLIVNGSDMLCVSGSGGGVYGWQE